MRWTSQQLNDHLEAHPGIILATGISDTALTNKVRMYSVNCAVLGQRYYRADEIPTSWVTRTGILDFIKEKHENISKNEFKFSRVAN